jgi:putative ABC transport system substrate-binding protein
MKRREFIALVGGLAIGAPRVACTQPAAQLRRIGVLMNLPDGDPEAQRRIDAFLKSMSALGWDDGKNIHVDYRYGVGPQIVNKNAAELVALAPDVILANAPPAVLAVQQATHTIPVVFAAVTDPVALSLVQSLARPGGNVTGFSPAELGLSAKWLELLKEIMPEVKRVAVFRAASNPGSETQISIIETAARAMAVDIRIIDVSDTAAMERDVADFASAADGGLIAIRTSENVAARHDIIALAARYRLPAVYPLRFFATDGGLVSYGPDIVDEYREAAGYVDRILKSAKPMDLPVQSASKFELTINLKTAKQLGLTIPPSLLATADEVIE